MWDPRPAITIGVLLIAGSAAGIALTWPPTHASLRPFIVGVLLVLRGLALPLLQRRRARARQRRHRRTVPDLQR
jgi:ABC-type xylose transport system permease subunit